MSINKATLAKEVDGTIEYIYPKTTADMVDYTAQQTVEQKLQQLSTDLGAIDVAGELQAYYTKTEVDDLLYEPIVINSVTVNPSTAEAGSTQNVTVSWAASKKPVTLTVDGNSISNPNASGSTTISGVSANKTISVVATDAGKSTGSPASSTKSATISFYNPLYYGAAANPASVDSAFVLALSGKKIQGSVGCSFSVIAGSSQYIWFACPATFSPSFAVGGFSGGFELVSTFNFTNASGATASYKVYKSQNAALGSTTVVVS